jgi:SAM-dependent methyltransferase
MRAIEHIVQVAESTGWNIAMYRYARTEIGAGHVLAEDERAADWRFLLPTGGRTRTALVLGCGLGTIPVALCDMFAKVYAVDVIPARVRLLELRAAQHRIANLVPIHVAPGGPLPFEAERFDLIVARSSDWDFGSAPPRGGVAVATVARDVRRLLEAGGIVYLSVPNRLSYQRLLRPGSAGAGLARSLGGYRRDLAAAGFVDIRFYAPLPSHEGIPLFYVPLADPALLEYFFDSIFPLLEAVSPEVKGLYGREYRVAKSAVRLAGPLRLTGLARYFVPGFGIVARRDAGDASGCRRA